MKEAIVCPSSPEVTVTLHDVPLPVPKENEILIRVVVAASNVKGMSRRISHIEDSELKPTPDYKHLYASGKRVNSGDDVSGFVEAVGSAVERTKEFRVGDRVAGFHEMLMPGGAYAEYAVVPSHTAFLIPDNVSFEGKCLTSRRVSGNFSNFFTEASTIPLTMLAAALPLFRRQSLPAPWMRRSSNAPPLPLIIYGASSALGCFAVKLALLANIHPLIAICGSTTSYISSLLKPELGDTIVDYRQGVDRMKANVKEALKGVVARNALDAISENGTWIPLSQMVDPMDGQVSVVQGGGHKYDEPEIPPGVQISYTYVGSAHYGKFLPGMPKQPDDSDTVCADVDFAYVMMRYVARALATGEFTGHPVETIAGGLDGVETGLQKLQRGEARGVKYIYRIGETKGLSS